MMDMDDMSEEEEASFSHEFTAPYNEHILPDITTHCATYDSTGSNTLGSPAPSGGGWQNGGGQWGRCIGSRFQLLCGATGGGRQR